MSRRGSYQRNAKDKGYASRLHDGFDIDIDYVVPNDNQNPPSGEGGEDAPLVLSPLQVASLPAAPPPAPSSAVAASSSSLLSDGSEEGITAAADESANGGFVYYDDDEALQAAMRESRALLYRQNN